jgi:hypothetical protein
MFLRGSCRVISSYDARWTDSLRVSEKEALDRAMQYLKQAPAPAARMSAMICPAPRAELLDRPALARRARLEGLLTPSGWLFKPSDFARAGARGPRQNPESSSDL